MIFEDAYCRDLIENDYIDFGFDRDYIISNDMVEKLVRMKPSLLKKMPLNMVTNDLCKIYIDAGEKLAHLRMQLHTPALARYAYDRGQLEAIPALENVTYEMWLTYVDKFPYGMPRVPNEYKTEEMCIIAIRKGGDYYAYNYISLQTRNIFLVSFECNQYMTYPDEIIEEFLEKDMEYSGIQLKIFKQYFRENGISKGKLYDKIMNIIKAKKNKIRNEEFVLQTLQPKQIYRYSPIIKQLYREVHVAMAKGNMRGRVTYFLNIKRYVPFIIQIANIKNICNILLLSKN